MIRYAPLAGQVLLAAAIGCGGGGSSSGGSDSLSLSFNTSSVQASLTTPGILTVTLTRAGSMGSVTLTVQGLPPEPARRFSRPGSLAAQYSDGTVIVMVANHAVNATTDNNGPGAPRSVLIDTIGSRTISDG